MKQTFFVLISLLLLATACKTTRSTAKARNRMVGKYKMEMTIDDKELANSQEAQQLLKDLNLSSDFKPDGQLFMNMEMQGQTKKDTANWNISGDSLIIRSKQRREALLMKKSKGGFTIALEGNVKVKYTKLK